MLLEWSCILIYWIIMYCWPGRGLVIMCGRQLLLNSLNFLLFTIGTRKKAIHFCLYIIKSVSCILRAKIRLNSFVMNIFCLNWDNIMWNTMLRQTIQRMVIGFHIFIKWIVVNEPQQCISNLSSSNWYIFMSKCLAFMSLGDVWVKKRAWSILWTFFLWWAADQWKNQSAHYRGLKLVYIVWVLKSCWSRVWTGSELTSLRNGFFSLALAFILVSSWMYRRSAVLYS